MPENNTGDSLTKYPWLIDIYSWIIQAQGEEWNNEQPGAARHKHFGYLQRNLRGRFLDVHIRPIHPVVSVHYESKRSRFYNTQMDEMDAGLVTEEAVCLSIVDNCNPFNGWWIADINHSLEDNDYMPWPLQSWLISEEDENIIFVSLDDNDVTAVPRSHVGFARLTPAQGSHWLSFNLTWINCEHYSVVFEYCHPTALGIW